MILKSYIIEKNTELLDKYKSILMYGENEGIKDDIKIKIKERKKNAEIINIFEEEIIRDKDILFNHINNSSLFSSEKLIFLHGITDKVFNQINESIEKEIKDVNIYIFSSILEKRSKIRNYFEKENKLGVVACYEDNERTLSNYIITHLKGHGGLTQEIVNIIISNSNLNRKIIKNEIEKIKNCFFKKNTKSNCINADLIILLTEWDEFKSIDFKSIVKNKKFKIYDLRNLYNTIDMKRKKIKYFSVGRPSTI